MTQKPVSIFVAIINNFPMLHLKFVQSLFSMIAEGEAAGHNVQLEIIDRYDISIMRNCAVERAKEIKANYILFLDSDMIYCHDTITRLLSHDKEVVGGYYIQRMPPNKPNHFNSYSLLSLDCLKPNEGLKKQLWGGLGGVLVKTEVFSKLQEPYFKFDYQGTDRTPEDMFFFKQLEKAGIPAYVDTDLHFGHIINGAIYPDGKIYM